RTVPMAWLLSARRFFVITRRPPRSTLFPYTRSSDLTSTPDQEHRWRSVYSAVLLVQQYPSRRSSILDDEGGNRHQAPAAWILLRSEEHTSELQSRENLVCRLLLEKKKADTRHCLDTL